MERQQCGAQPTMSTEVQSSLQNLLCKKALKCTEHGSGLMQPSRTSYFDEYATVFLL